MLYCTVLGCTIEKFREIYICFPGYYIFTFSVIYFYNIKDCELFEDCNSLFSNFFLILASMNVFSELLTNPRNRKEKVFIERYLMKRYLHKTMKRVVGKGGVSKVVLIVKIKTSKLIPKNDKSVLTIFFKKNQ